ncbi:MAG: hypothetical protein LBU51_01870, partial [Bacteroidales bacterium]|nr:hypothetical protein [Bacteroidales bacterium]
INEADEEIKSWAAELKNGLEHNKSITYDNFGTFSKDDKGEIVFKSALIKELNIDFEGMEPITIAEKEVVEVIDKEEVNEIIAVSGVDGKGEVKKNKEVEEEKKIEEVKQVEEVVEIRADEVVEETKVVENKNVKKSRGWLIVLIILLVLIGIAVAAYFCCSCGKERCENVKNKFCQTQFLQTSAGVVPADTLVLTEIAKDTIIVPEAEVVVEAEVPAVAPSNSSKEVTISIAVPDKFYVIAGSFKSEEMARDHIKKSPLKKFNPKLLIQEDVENTRISIGEFKTRKAAQAFGEKSGVPFWILSL